MLRGLETRLSKYRLVEEASFGGRFDSEREREWVRQNRPPAAAYWNVLSYFRPENLRYVA